MAAQIEVGPHGPPARGQPPWPWHLLLLAHGRAAQPHPPLHRRAPPPAPHAGSSARPRARELGLAAVAHAPADGAETASKWVGVVRSI